MKQNIPNITLRIFFISIFYLKTISKAKKHHEDYYPIKKIRTLILFALITHPNVVFWHNIGKIFWNSSKLLEELNDENFILISKIKISINMHQKGKGLNH